MGKNPGFTQIADVVLVLTRAILAFATWGQVGRNKPIQEVLMSLQGTFEFGANAATL